MQIRETDQRRKDGECYVMDNNFIYSSLQLLFNSHYSVMIFPPKVSPVLFDTETHRHGKNTQ